MDSPNLIQKHFAVVDYVVFGFLLLCSVLIGVYFGFFAKQKQNTTKEYLMGGKAMGIFPISMSLISSFITGSQLLAVPAEIYVHGMQFFMVVVGQLIANFIMMSVFLPVFYALQITSSYEYLKLRFNQSVRILGSLLFILKMFLYIPIAMYTPALAFNQVTGIQIHLITPIIGLICIFYTTVGGFKAVVWTDTFQTVLMYGGIATVMILGTSKVGGFSKVVEINQQTDRLEFFNMDLDPTLRSTFWTVAVGEMFTYLSCSAVNQAMNQRCLAMANLRRSNWTVIILAVGVFCIATITCYIGLVIYAFFHGCDPLSTKMIGKADQLLPFFVMQISESHPGLPGIFVAGIFSAALSSMSSGLNSMTGVILQDLIKPLLKRPITELTASNIMKVVAAIIGFICVGLVFLVGKAGSLLQLLYCLSSITSGALLGVFTLGMFFPWANSIGAMSGSIASVIVVAWISFKGKVFYEQKAVFTDHCPEEFLNQTSYIADPNNLHSSREDVFYIYRISYMYYVLIGTIIVIVVGMAVSYATGFRDPRDVSRDLLTPVIHRFLPKQPIMPEEEKMNKLAADFVTPLQVLKAS